MSETAAPGSLFGRYDFLVRRLHSLSGLVPVGAYMVIHLTTNATVWDGARGFQSRVDQIHSLGWMLPAVEWTFIFIPLLFHAFVGLFLIRGSHQNVGHYPYSGNVRYFLQRATAWIALVFIFWHVFEMHGWIKPLAADLHGARFKHLYATSSAAAVLQSSPFMVAFYFVGISACVYHLANGIWTSGITWGLWTTKAAQRRANFVCIAFGLLLTTISMAAFFGMLRVDPKEAFTEEQKINARKHAADEITQEELEDVPDLFKTPVESTKAEQATRGEKDDQS